MRHHEVLPAGLADQPRIAAVAIDPLPHALPHLVEDAGRAGEVDSCQVRVGQHLLGDLRRAAAHQVDDSGRQARFLEQPHEEVGGEQRLGGRLEDHHVAEQGRCGGKVPHDRREVERRDREGEAFQRPVLQPVPGGRVVGGLLRQQLVGEEGVVAPEVDQLAGGVDLGLVRCLALAEHGGRVDGVPPGPGQQGGGAQEDRGPRLEGCACPGGACGQRSLDRGLYIRWLPDGVLGDHELVPVRRCERARLATVAAFAADYHRDLGPGVRELGQPSLQARSVGTAGLVRTDGFVVGLGDPKVAISAHRDVWAQTRGIPIGISPFRRQTCGKLVQPGEALIGWGRGRGRGRVPGSAPRW